MSLPAFPDSVPLTAFRLPRNCKRYRYIACAIVCHTATSIYGNLIGDALFLPLLVNLSVVSSQAPFPYFVRVFALRFRTSSLDAVSGQFQDVVEGIVLIGPLFWVLFSNMLFSGVYAAVTLGVSCLVCSLSHLNGRIVLKCFVIFTCFSMSTNNKVLNSGTPEGTTASTSLPEDAWDLLGLGAVDGMNDRELHIKNGQVCLLTGGDYMSAKRRYALENREAHRAQWRQQAEQRLAKARGMDEKASFHI